MITNNCESNEYIDFTKFDTFDTAKDAFMNLIDEVSGKGAWERNPLVFAYEFELIDEDHEPRNRL